MRVMPELKNIRGRRVGEKDGYLQSREGAKVRILGAQTHMDQNEEGTRSFAAGGRLMSPRK